MRKKKRFLHLVQRIPIRWRLTLVSLGMLTLLLSALGMIISSIAEQVLVTNEVTVLKNEVQVAWKGAFKSMPPQDHPFVIGNTVFTWGPPPTNFNSGANALVRALSSANTGTDATILTSDGRSLTPDPDSPYIEPDQVQQIMQSDQWYMLTRDGRGYRQLIVFIPLTNVSNNALHTVGILQISTPTTPIDNFLTPFHQTLFFGIIGALALAIALTFPLVGLALRPLVEIERTSRRIAQGNLSMRIDPPSTNDEIGRLARSFNRMVAQLEAAFQRQKRFVADVSHELRTPLTALSGSLEMLLIGADQGDVEASRRLAHGMYNEVQRMQRMVEDLLALTRLDEGKLTLRKEVVDLETLLQTVRGQAEHLAAGQQISCEVEVDLPPILGDKDRLQQVLLNLLDNALKFTPPEGKVELQARKKGQNTVLITVRDTGQGIPAEALPHIFDRFYRADPSRSRSPRHAGGSGLGLAIAREMVEAQNGTIDIRSILGEGTIVILSFPTLQRTQRPKRLSEKRELSL